MDRRDVETEDTEKPLEDEVVGGQESVKNDHLGVEVGDKQEDPPGLTNSEIQDPDEIAIEEENPTKKDEENMQPNQNEQESTVDEAQDSVKDDKAMDDDKTQDSEKDATAVVDDEIHDSEKDATAMDDDKFHDGEKDATAMDDDKFHDSDKDDTVMHDDKFHDGEKDATAMDDDKFHDGEKDATAVDDDKFHDSEKNTTAMDDDKLHDGEKNETAMQDDKFHDSEKDATGMDDDHGVLEETEHDASMKMPEDRNEGDHQELATPNSHVKRSPSKAKDHSAETPKNGLEDEKMDEGYESGTLEDQETFMKEVEAFYREKSLEFKPPKFYGQPLNCLKLWKSVIKLGGYDRVTGSKLWRQVGESFHPPKTCTTVSWTFRQFYEKALLEYERHKIQSGEAELPLATVCPLSTVFPEAPSVENEANGHQTPGSGRARRDAAARAMQGWHSQRLFGYGEEKNSNSSQKREKSLKSIGSIKQKRPNEVEHPVKALKTETSRQVVTTVADVGPPADWVKINVRETKDCFEVYALVPGLLREEVRVQSDPAGRLVITGQPEQPDNPWGITAFKKVISLPSRIDPLHTSAIVSLHGRLLVRVPFEQSNI